MNSEITRRAALQRFAAAAGLVAWGGLPSLAQASDSGLTPDRVAVLRTLAAAFDRRPGSLVDLSQGDVTALARARYDTSSTAYCAWVEALLDAAESAPAGGRLTALTVSGARREIRSWVGAVQPGDRDRSRYRPADKDEPTDLASSNKRMTESIRAFTASLTPDALAPDERKVLPKFAPENSGLKLPTPQPIADEVLALRALRVDVYKFVASLYSSDRYLVDDVIL